MLLGEQTMPSAVPWNAITLSISAIVAGVGWFFHGFRSYRQERRVTNTAVSRCDSMAAGKVAVCGNAHATKLFPALFSGTECIFSSCKVYKEVSDGKNNTWELVASITHPPRPSFILEDHSGSVAVLPAGAEFILRSTHFESGDSMAQGGSDLLSMHDPMGDAKFRVDEMTLDEGAAIYVYGFATDGTMVTPDAQSLDGPPENGKLVIWNRPGSEGFLLTDESPKEVAGDLSRSFAFSMIGGPAAILAGVGIIAWLLFSGPLAHVVARLHPVAVPTVALMPKVNEQAFDGTTALMRTARVGNGARVRYLLSAGAEPNIVDARGRTALHFAAIARSQASIAALLASKPLLDLQDDAGNTPLHLAARNGDLAVVNQLLNAGANVNVRNFAKQTAQDLARTSRSPYASAIAMALRNASHP